MKKGWIKLHRKILDSPISDNSELAWCWVRFILEASHQEHFILIGLQKIRLLPGQFIWGEKAWGKKLNISSSKARRLKNILKSEEQIEEQITNKYTLITIVNWEKYQGDEEQSDEQVKSKRRASEEQVKTNKNVKNVNNEKNDKKEIHPCESGLSQDIVKIIELFRELSPSLNYGNKTQRNACEEMIKKFGFEATLSMAQKVIQIQGEKYAPRATTPYSMWQKIGDFAVYFKSKKSVGVIDIPNC